MKIHLDETRWPLLRVDYPSEIDEEEWRDHIRKLEVHVLRQDRFAVVLNTRDCHFNKEQRNAIEMVVKDHKVHCEKYVAGVALVVGSKIQMAALSIISWISKPTFPVHIFTELDAAEQWALDKIGGGDDRSNNSEPARERSENGETEGPGRDDT